MGDEELPSLREIVQRRWNFNPTLRPLLYARCPGCGELRSRFTEFNSFFRRYLIDHKYCRHCLDQMRQSWKEREQGFASPIEDPVSAHSKREHAQSIRQRARFFGTRCRFCGGMFRGKAFEPSEAERLAAIHVHLDSYEVLRDLCPDCRPTPIQITEDDRDLLAWFLEEDPKPVGHDATQLDVSFDVLTEPEITHTWILGRSGYGKTTLLKLLLRHHFESGGGCAFIDPHGDAASELLGCVPESRLDDVIYFAPAAPACPSLNLLALPYRKDKLTDDIVSLFKLFFGGLDAAPRLLQLMRQGLLTLLADTEPHSLADLQRLYVDPRYREAIVARCSNDRLRAFWEHQFPAMPKDAPQSLLNKLDPFLGAFSPLEKLLSSPRNDLDFPSIIGGKKIFLANLAKGELGEQTTALLGGLLMTAFSQAALARADQPEQRREPFHLVADEFQTYLVDSFATIFSEARKYGLRLTLANQTTDQVGNLYNVLMGNVSALVVFQVAATDAARLKREMCRTITPNPKAHFYLEKAEQLRRAARHILDRVTSKVLAPLCAPISAPYLDDTFWHWSTAKVIDDIRRYRDSGTGLLSWEVKEDAALPEPYDYPDAGTLQSLPKLTAVVRRHTLDNVHRLAIAYPPPPSEDTRRRLLDMTRERFSSPPAPARPDAMEQRRRPPQTEEEEFF